MGRVNMNNRARFGIPLGGVNAIQEFARLLAVTYEQEPATHFRGQPSLPIRDGAQDEQWFPPSRGRDVQIFSLPLFRILMFPSLVVVNHPRSYARLIRITRWPSAYLPPVEARCSGLCCRLLPQTLEREGGIFPQETAWLDWAASLGICFAIARNMRSLDHFSPPLLLRSPAPGDAGCRGSGLDRTGIGAFPQNRAIVHRCAGAPSSPRRCDHWRRVSHPQRHRPLTAARIGRFSGVSLHALMQMAAKAYPGRGF